MEPEQEEEESAQPEPEPRRGCPPPCAASGRCCSPPPPPSASAPPPLPSAGSSADFACCKEYQVRRFNIAAQCTFALLQNEHFSLVLERSCRCQPIIISQNESGWWRLALGVVQWEACRSADSRFSPSSSILHSHIGSNGRPVGNGEGQGMTARYSRTTAARPTFAQHRPGPAAGRLTDRRQPRLVHT